MTSPGSARVAAAAVPGCQHVLAGGLPCQDAVKTRIDAHRVLLALADGHGDADYPQSGEGARIAVDVAIEALAIVTERLLEMPRAPDESSLEAEVALPLRRRIAFEWNRRVKHHIKMTALRDDRALLWPSGVTGDWDESVRPYGTTLLAAAMIGGAAIWLRVGDGEVLRVAGTSARRVFPASDKSMGQATRSLSSRGALDSMEIALDHDLPELALLASDGVGDQYDEHPSFEEEWGTRMLERIKAKGWIETAMELPRYLGTLARDGDDCSVALAWFAKD